MNNTFFLGKYEKHYSPNTNPKQYLFHQRHENSNKNSKIQNK